MLPSENLGTSVVKQASLGKKGKGISVKKVYFFFRAQLFFFFFFDRSVGFFLLFFTRTLVHCS